MSTFIHRARDPVGEDFVYWFANELDLDGASYVGPPAFGTLVDPTFIRVVLSEGGLGLRWQAGGESGELDGASHDAAPADTTSVSGSQETAPVALRFQVDGVSGDLSQPSLDTAPADASAVSEALETAPVALRFQVDGVSGDLSQPSLDTAPADASAVTGGYALIP